MFDLAFVYFSIRDKLTQSRPFSRKIRRLRVCLFGDIPSGFTSMIVYLMR